MSTALGLKQPTPLQLSKMSTCLFIARVLHPHTEDGQ
jgi:hypothetical protein